MPLTLLCLCQLPCEACHKYWFQFSFDATSLPPLEMLLHGQLYFYAHGYGTDDPCSLQLFFDSASCHCCCCCLVTSVFRAGPRLSWSKLLFMSLFASERLVHLHRQTDVHIWKRSFGLLQGKVVDEIINEWNAELERRSRSFVKQAEALAQWDHRILTNRQTLLELEEQLRKVGLDMCLGLHHSRKNHGLSKQACLHIQDAFRESSCICKMGSTRTETCGLNAALWQTPSLLRLATSNTLNPEVQAHKGQESLERKVALLEAHQKEIHDSLVSMENVAVRMYQVAL